jgi:hypothetical protein
LRLLPDVDPLRGVKHTYIIHVTFPAFLLSLSLCGLVRGHRTHEPYSHARVIQVYKPIIQPKALFGFFKHPKQYKMTKISHPFKSRISKLNLSRLLLQRQGHATKHALWWADQRYCDSGSLDTRSTATMPCIGSTTHVSTATRSTWAQRRRTCWYVALPDQGG